MEGCSLKRRKSGAALRNENQCAPTTGAQENHLDLIAAQRRPQLGALIPRRSSQGIQVQGTEQAADGQQG